MKQHLTQVFAIILIGSLLIAGCNKDEDTPPNSFKYSDKESLIGNAFAGNLGEYSNTGVYGSMVYFLENTLTVHLSNGSPDSLSGVGDYMVLAMLGTDSAGISPGEYKYNSGQSSLAKNTFGYGESGLLINYDASGTTNSPSLEFNGGTVTVAKNGEEYEITFSVKTTTNTTVTGFYKGKVPMYEMFGKKKSSNQNPFRTQFFK
jgi:hypothetical protein